jgi:hypothetical protein
LGTYLDLPFHPYLKTISNRLLRSTESEMPPYIYILALLGATSPALAQLSPSTTSGTRTVDLFVMGSGGTAVSSISASIITAYPSRNETAYYVNCEMATDNEGRMIPQSPPCDYIDGASVTINPGGMHLTLERESLIVSGTSGESYLLTDINV